MQKNFILVFLFYLFGIPLLGGVSYLGTIYRDSLVPLLVSFLITYAVTVALTIKQNGIFSLYAIYLYTSMFFIYNCFVFHLLTDNNFLFQTFPYLYWIEPEYGIIFIICCYLSVYFTHIAYCLKKTKKYAKSQVNHHNPQWEFWGKLLMYVFFVPVVVKSLIDFRYILNDGYFAIFTGTKINYPIWSFGAFMAFTAGYLIFLASNPNKKNYIIFSTLFFGIYMLSAIKGQRSQIISLFIFLFYWFCNKYNYHVRWRQIVLIGIFVISTTCILGLVRESYGDSNPIIVKEKFGDLLIKNLYEQTTSRVVPLLIIQGNLQYRYYPFIFAPLLQPINKILYQHQGLDITYAEKFNDISAVTMYNVSPNAYLAGRGYGGAFLAEAYDLGGYLGVAALSFLLGLFLSFCDYSKLQVKNIYVPILFYCIMTIIILPRGRCFGFMADINKIIFTYVILLFIIILTHKKDNKILPSALTSRK